jgi:hypothetical protein
MSNELTPKTDAFADQMLEEFIDPAWLVFSQQLERELTEVTKQRDALAEAIITHRAKAFPLTGEDFDQELWQALQSLTNPNEL